MTDQIDTKEIQKIVNFIKGEKFDLALNIIKKLSLNSEDKFTVNKLFAFAFFKKKDWSNAILYYKKILPFEKDNYKILTNIGFAYFKLGQIRKSIKFYNKSINENPKSDPTYNNLAISYTELGLYEKAYFCFLEILKINKESSLAKKNLIYLLNFINPKKNENDEIVKLNNKIKELSKNFNFNNLHKIDKLKKILTESNNIIDTHDKNLFLEETQIYRKNLVNLNCERHFKVFNTHNIIPNFCFSCYKIQINLLNVIDLIKLFFIFDNIKFENNNIRKCIVELRDKIEGNYKGYVYCRSLEESIKIKEELEKTLINRNLINFKIDIKHGCSEFYNSYPEFKKIDFKTSKDFNYKKSWAKKEKHIDNLEPIRSDKDKKIMVSSLRGLNLSDILIIKNWLNYAFIIGDNSYKKLYSKNFNNNFLNTILNNQLNFRKNNLKV